KPVNALDDFFKDSVHICSHVRLFDQALRRSRDTDDKIVNVINRTLQSGDHSIDRQSECRKLHEKLNSESQRRVSLIKDCIEQNEKGQKTVGVPMWNLKNELIVRRWSHYWGIDL
ncbi:hypothetical protein ACOME3_007383, partial [Neoechinorhynchus agilis]